MNNDSSFATIEEDDGELAIVDLELFRKEVVGLVAAMTTSSGDPIGLLVAIRARSQSVAYCRELVLHVNEIWVQWFSAECPTFQMTASLAQFQKFVTWTRMMSITVPTAVADSSDPATNDVGTADPTPGTSDAGDC